MYEIKHDMTAFEEIEKRLSEINETLCGIRTALWFIAICVSLISFLG